jgi:hypothetical protein
MKNIDWIHPRVIGDAFLMSKSGFIEFYCNEYSIDKQFAEVVWIGIRDVYTSYDKGHLNSSTLKHIKPDEFTKVKLEIIQGQVLVPHIDLKELNTPLNEQIEKCISEVFMGEYSTKKKKVFRLLELGGSIIDIVYQFKMRNLDIDQNYVKELTVLYKKEHG